MSDFGSRFASLFKGSTQKQIATALGVTDSAVRNYLGGRVPDRDKLQAITDLTGCNLHWLLTGSGEKLLTEQNVRNTDTIDSLSNTRIREVIPREPVSLEHAIKLKIREIVNEEMLSANRGTAKEFDIDSSVKRHDNALLVLREWYAFDGMSIPEISAMAFSDWDKLTLDQKVAQVRSARDQIEEDIEFENAKKNAPKNTNRT